MRRMSMGALALSALGVVLSCAAPLHAATSSEVQEILTLVNQRRAEAGLQPLRLQSQLLQSAQGYAEYLANGGAFSHTGSDGSTPYSRMTAAGYRGTMMGENIAKGFSSAISVMEAWMNSPGHRANILNPGYTDLGVGVSGDAWVQDFGASTSSSMPTAPEEAPPPAPLGPTITGIDPTSQRMGQPIAINGQRLGSSGSVTFTGGLIGDASSWTDSKIVVTVPMGAQTGPLYVQTQNGTSAGAFFYVLNPTGYEPFLYSVRPTSAPAGTVVTIYGRNLGPQQGTVTFGGVPAAVTHWSMSGFYLTCVVPQGTAGGPIVVTRADDGQKTNEIAFTVLGASAAPSAAPQPPVTSTPPTSLPTPPTPPATTPPSSTPTWPTTSAPPTVPTYPSTFGSFIRYRRPSWW